MQVVREKPSGASHAGMLLACTAGTLLGLVLDTRDIDAEALLAMCGSGPDVLARWQREWRWMPATHALTWSAAACFVLVAEWRLRQRGSSCVLARWCAHAATLLGMALGMAWAQPWAPLLAAWSGSATVGLVAAMALGMAAGLGVALPVCRMLTPRTATGRQRPASR